MSLSGEQINNYADDFLNNLTIPEGADSKPQFAVMLIGLIGSGKSTVLDNIIKEIPMARVAGDDIRSMVGEDLNGEETSAIGELITDKLMDRGNNIAYDNDFANPAIRLRKQEIHHQNSIREIWIHVNPPLEWIQEQHKNRDKWMFKDADEAMARTLGRLPLHTKEALKDIPFDFQIDPSRPDYDQQISECISVIRKRLNSK